jgi:signal transduction histidine kinase
MRLVEIGQWVAELIHDIKHPVATVSSAAQTLQNLPNIEGSSLRLAAIIREEINHLNKLVDGLLHMVKPEQARYMPYEVNELVDRIVPVIRGKMGDNGNITFRWRPDPERAVVMVDADQMQEVFTNIAVNALEAIQGEGTLAIAAKANQDTVQIAFVDTGLGISEHELGLIFNPFYSTKMNGIGLGLVIARRIVEDHNGYIDVVSPAEAGTTFTVTLPRQVE